MRRGRLAGLRSALASACVLATGVASGEVTTDGSLGPAQAVTAVGNEYRITDDLGRYSANGASLFQSFSLFNIETGRTASFSATRTPERVIARVTGGSLSSIDGRLRTVDGAVGADLFLLNPSGIAFGPNASFDLKGSFYVSTADRLHFVSGPDFDATSSAPDPELSIAAPSAFGFLSEAPAPIILNQPGILHLPVGETFSAIGGPIRLTGQQKPGISISSGRIQLAAVDHPTDVPIDLTSFGGAALAAAVAVDDVPDVTIEQGFNIDVNGDSQTAGPAGQVVIRGGSLIVDNSHIDAVHRSAQAATAPAIDIEMLNDVDVRSGARLTSQSYPKEGRGGDISIRGRLVRVSGANALGQSSTIQTQTFAAGAGGELRITADVIEVSSGGSLVTLAGLEGGGSGPGGGLVLVAAEGVRVFEAGAILSSARGTGEGGRIGIAAQTLDVTNGGQIVSEAKAAGAGGDIVIEADRVFVSNETDRANPAAIATLALAGGAGGDLTLGVRELELAHGGAIATRTDAAGAGGNLAVQAAESVQIAGVDAAGQRASLRATTNQGSTGDGGSLTLGAPVVEVSNGGQISTLTQGTGDAGSLAIDASERLTVSGGANGTSNISADSRVVGEITPIPGGAGALTVRTGSLELRDGGQITASTEGASDSGKITITADSVAVSGSDPAFHNASGVFSRSNAEFAGGGNALGIDIEATGDVILSHGGKLSSSTLGYGDAGEILVNAGGRIVLEDAAQITASAEGSLAAKGGAIPLTAANGVFLSGGSSILAVSSGAGSAGDVKIDAGPRLELRDNSEIRTDAQNGTGGNITIHAREIVWLHDSSLVTSVHGVESGGGGGDIFIDPQFVVLDGSNIRANATLGTGGNITIKAGTFFHSPDSLVDASSTLGIDGSVSIVAPDTDVTSGITTLPSLYLDATALMRNACSAATAQGGSFVVSTRAGLPISPDAPLAAFAGAATAASIAQAKPSNAALAGVALADDYQLRSCARAQQEVL